MSHFHYQDGELYAEGVPVSRIAAEVGTPFYCYSTAKLSDNYRNFESALGGLNARLYFSLKANSNQAVIKTLASLGAGADVVSVGEMYRALKAGIPAGDIVFAGVGTAGSLDVLAAEFNHGRSRGRSAAALIPQRLASRHRQSREAAETARDVGIQT